MWWVTIPGLIVSLFSIVPGACVPCGPFEKNWPQNTLISPSICSDTLKVDSFHFFQGPDAESGFTRKMPRSSTGCLILSILNTQRRRYLKSIFTFVLQSGWHCPRRNASISGFQLWIFIPFGRIFRSDWRHLTWLWWWDHHGNLKIGFSMAMRGWYRTF